MKTQIYRNIFTCCSVCVCETLCLSHWEMNIGRGCSRIGWWGRCGPKKDEGRGEWIDRTFMICSPRLSEWMKNEIGWTCGPYGEKERCTQGFGMETWWKESIWKT
jgi:hypothetical protein